MPFGNFFKKEKVPKSASTPPLTDKEKKSLFGLKVVQAQQNPEPVYDLSNCSAPILPNDTFTFCKLLGKTTLNVKGNALTTLESGGMIQDLTELKILDASENKIDKIPSTFMYLKALQVLNLSKNLLRSLPDAITYLHNLRELYLSNNKFAKLPLPVCSLKKLCILDLKGNSITCIPKELSGLQNSLMVLKLDFEKVKGLPEGSADDVEVLMRHLCKLNGMEYEGIKESNDIELCSSEDSTDNKIDNYEIDEVMLTYMRRKDEQLRVQLAEEEKIRDKEKEQLENMLQNVSANKEELLMELSNCHSHIINFEDEKKRKLQGHIQLEEQFRNEQNERLDLYLSNATNKESLIQDISAQESCLQKEVLSIVEAKDNDRARLLKELSTAEEETTSALEELLNFQQAQKSSEFAKLINDQEAEIQKIISGLAESSVEYRQSDVMKAMQEALMKEAWTQMEREKIEAKQKSWVISLVKEGEMEMSHLENIITNRATDQEAFVANLLQEEKYQEEAFRVLLSSVDLKRNNVIHQIALVEYELIRLSALEVRKKMCGIKDGSSKMGDHRKTLVDLLCSLFLAKDERDKELENWVSELSMRKGNKKTSEDFWLQQYQQLMNMKPAGISEAEENLDPKVHQILMMSNTLNLLPLFSKNEITFPTLLEMSEEDFAKLEIGSATYHSIQRALANYMANSKLRYEPSAPEVEVPTEFDEASASVGEFDATAPPLEQFVEAECVICLSNDCKVLFIPCGHVCVCSSCCQKLTVCPLCRSNIVNRCFVYAN